MKAQSVGGGWSGVVTGYPLVCIKESRRFYLARKFCNCSTQWVDKLRAEGPDGFLREEPSAARELARVLRVLQVLSPYIFCFFFWLFLTISPLGKRGLDIGCSLSASKEIFGCFFVVRGERG
jgi:hypothetical protein